MRVCSTPGCPRLHSGAGKCPECRADTDRMRRPHGNPYTSRGHQQFREQVLARDPICVECRADRATVADHAPTERWELVEQGLDPNDPEFGQGLCATCHNAKTAKSFGFGGSH